MQDNRQIVGRYAQRHSTVFRRRKRMRGDVQQDGARVVKPHLTSKPSPQGALASGR